MVVDIWVSRISNGLRMRCWICSLTGPPPTGVYRLRDSAEAKHDFFDKLEAIYAPSGEKAVVLDNWTRVKSVAPERVAPEPIAEGAFEEVNLDDLTEADFDSARRGLGFD